MSADDLVIFWPSDKGQDEVRGLYLYGLTLSETVDLDLKSLRAAWSPIAVQCDVDSCESELGKVLVLAIKLGGIPASHEWHSNLDRALSSVLHSGAIVAWAGGEDCSWAPEVLDPTSGFGNVLAAKCASTGFLCKSNIDEPTEFLDDFQLSALWSYVRAQSTPPNENDKQR